MPSYLERYLERYLAGERERVWDELVALCAAVREEPVYADALAVARETMRRVRANIETLIPRLQQTGYTFGFHALGLETELPALAGAYHTFLPPPSDIQERIEAIEKRAGLLPLSLRAWYETIGEVNFIGRPPGAWAVEPYTLDPLQVDPLEMVAESFELWLDEQAYSQSLSQDEKDKDEIEYFSRPRIEVMLDVDTKFGYSGLGGYEIIVPALSADARLDNHPQELWFIEYVRTSLRWVGFSGLELISGGWFPKDVLRGLTQGLLPI